jgi:hypothetical protein
MSLIEKSQMLQQKLKIINQERPCENGVDKEGDKEDNYLPPSARMIRHSYSNSTSSQGPYKAIHRPSDPRMAIDKYSQIGNISRNSYCSKDKSEAQINKAHREPSADNSKQDNLQSEQTLDRIAQLN